MSLFDRGLQHPQAPHHIPVPVGLRKSRQIQKLEEKPIPLYLLKPKLFLKHSTYSNIKKTPITSAILVFFTQDSVWHMVGSQ